MIKIILIWDHKKFRYDLKDFMIQYKNIYIKNSFKKFTLTHVDAELNWELSIESIRTRIMI